MGWLPLVLVLVVATLVALVLTLRGGLAGRAGFTELAGRPDVLRAPRPPHSVLVLDLDETLVHYDVEADFLHFRPHVALFLQEVARRFDEIVIFTAAMKEYADVALDELERMSGVRLARRYYRDSCRLVDGQVVKDLRILGEPSLARVLMVDNTPSAFSLQPQCGVPIHSYTGDPGDDHLRRTLVVLDRRLASVSD